MSKRRLGLLRGTGASLLAAAMAFAAPAGAAECTLDVLKAHQTAKARGWQFTCLAGPGIIKGFVTYPPTSVGCTFKTGALLPPPNPAWGGGLGMLQLFGGQVGAPALKNGWQFVRYEIDGGSFQLLPPTNAIVSAGAKMDKPNKTYNFKVTKLVLKKSSGICGNAIEQAF